MIHKILAGLETADRYRHPCRFCKRVETDCGDGYDTFYMDEVGCADVKKHICLRGEFVITFPEKKPHGDTFERIYLISGVGVRQLLSAERFTGENQFIQMSSKSFGECQKHCNLAVGFAYQSRV